VLENRTLLSNATWINPAGVLCDVGSNWSTGQAPGAGDTAIINTTAAATVTIQNGDNIQVQSVTSGRSAALAAPGTAVQLLISVRWIHEISPMISAGILFCLTSRFSGVLIRISVYSNSMFVSGELW
jgi:hypothetical protein